MKKFCGISLLLALLVSAPAQANHMAVGGYFGLNFNSASVSPLAAGADTGGKVGLGLGGFFEYMFMPMFGAQPEMRIIGRGYKVTTTGLELNYGATYLEFPLLGKVKFMEDQKLRPFALLGPAIGFKLGDGADVNGVSVPGNTNTESMHFAIQFGGGAEYEFMPGLAALGSLRYSVGLTNVSKGAGTSAKHRGLELLFGVSYALGGSHSHSSSYSPATPSYSTPMTPAAPAKKAPPKTAPKKRR